MKTKVFAPRMLSHLFGLLEAGKTKLSFGLGQQEPGGEGEVAQRLLGTKGVRLLAEWPMELEGALVLVS